VLIAGNLFLVVKVVFSIYETIEVALAIPSGATSLNYISVGDNYAIELSIDSVQYIQVSIYK